MDENGLALRKLRLDQLEPELRKEVQELAVELGHETAISSKSDLHFLFMLYQAEKVKERRSQEALKRAEDLIMRLSSLHYAAQRRELGKPASKSSGFHVVASEVPVGQKAREIFESLGITDERTMGHIVEVIGESKLESRAELAHMSDLGSELVKSLFGMKPDMLMQAKEDDYISTIETLENKKHIVDGWADSTGQEPIYRKTPEILFNDYHEIARDLGIEPPEAPAEPAALEEERKEKIKIKPIHPEDFIKVLRGLGFEVKRPPPHTILAHPDGRVANVQAAHKGNLEWGPGLIRTKLREIRIEVETFQSKREELGL